MVVKRRKLEWSSPWCQYGACPARPALTVGSLQIPRYRLFVGSVICSHTQAGPKNDPHTQRADAMTYYLLGELYVSVTGIILVRAGQNHPCHANI